MDIDSLGMRLAIDVGKVITDEGWSSTKEPNTEGVDFCIHCLKYFLDNNISYSFVKELYGRKNRMNKVCENCFYSIIRYGFHTGWKYLYCTKGIFEKTVDSNHTCKYWGQK